MSTNISINYLLQTVLINFILLFLIAVGVVTILSNYFMVTFSYNFVWGIVGLVLIVGAFRAPKIRIKNEE